MGIVRLPKGRIEELDGLRGIAILLVMLTHCWPDRGVLGFLHPITTAGWMGVDLFFCLSGFLITGILLDNLGKPDYYLNFYARRTIRIFPLYYVVLLAFTAISMLVNGGAPYRELRDTWGSVLWFFFYVANFQCSRVGHWPPNDGLTVTWSLQIEEQFYLTYPWVVAKAGKRHLIKLLTSVIVLSVLFRLSTYAAGLNPFVQYTLTFCRMDSLAMGGLVAVLFRTGRWPLNSTTTARLAVLAAGVVIAGQLLGGDSGWRADFNRTVGFTIISAGFALLLAWTVFHLGDGSTRFLRFRPLTYVGEVSYGLYMLHLPVLYATRALMRRLGIHSLELEMLAGMAAAIGTATVSWYGLERPVLRLKARFQNRESKATRSCA